MARKVLVYALEKKFKKMEKPLRKVVFKLLTELSLPANVAAEIFLVGDAFMKKNVLAFPAPKNFPRPDIKGKHLGEIYLNPDYIARENQQLIFMLIHGVLHLLGYDHKQKTDRIKMEKIERKLLGKIKHD